MFDAGETMGDTEPPTIQVLGQFEAFYRERYRPVVALIFALTGNRWAAEDLAQETFLRAHRDWEQVRQMREPAAWVRRVALNLAMSRFRRLRAAGAARARLTPTPPAVTQPLAEQQELWSEVRKLPSRQCQVLALRYMDDLSTRQIADVLEIAEGTVSALLAQGKERLGRQLEAKGWRHD